MSSFYNKGIPRNSSQGERADQNSYSVFSFKSLFLWNFQAMSSGTSEFTDGYTPIRLQPSRNFTSAVIFLMKSGHENEGLWPRLWWGWGSES